MVKLHTLKIKPEFIEDKLSGMKQFEIRKNDRNFEVGDIIKYIADGEVNSIERAMLENKIYEIIYITDYEQKDGYIVFGEMRLK